MASGSDSSKKEDHLTELFGLTHKEADKERLGCISEHQSNWAKKPEWPDCAYRVNAIDYAVANEPHIYNVPSFRTPVAWLRMACKWLEPVYFAESNKEKAGQERFARPIAPVCSRCMSAEAHDDPCHHCWDLELTIPIKGYNPKRKVNYHVWDMPFFNNAHHIITRDEIYRALKKGDDIKELRILVASKYNVNRSPNSILLPQQECVAFAIQLPAHTPDKCDHDQYSMRLRTKLADLRREFVENEEEEGHQVTEKNAPKLVSQLETYSKEMRDFLINVGYKKPGIKLDDLSLP